MIVMIQKWTMENFYKVGFIARSHAFFTTLLYHYVQRKYKATEYG